MRLKSDHVSLLTHRLITTFNRNLALTEYKLLLNLPVRLKSLYILFVCFTLSVISNRALCLDIDSLKQVIANNPDLKTQLKSHQYAAIYYAKNNDENQFLYHARLLLKYYESGDTKWMNYSILHRLIQYHSTRYNIDSGLYLILIAERILKEKNAPQVKRLWLMHSRSGFLYSQESYKQAYALLDSILKALQVIDSTDYFQARVKWSIGNIYNAQGEIEKSLTFYLASIKYFEENNSAQDAGLIYNTAMIYYRLKEWEKAEELFLKSMNINIKEGQPEWLANSYNALGEVCQELVQYTRAYNYFILAEQNFDSLDLPRDVALIHGSIGNLYLAMANDTNQQGLNINEIELSYINLVDSAAFYFNSALQVAEKYNDEYVIRIAYRGMGLVLVKANEFKSAIYYLTKWERIADRVGDRYAMVEANKELATTYFKEAIRLMKINKINQANEHLLSSIKYRAAYQILNDSIFSNKKIRELSEKEKEYQLDKKDRETLIEADRVEAIEIGRRKNLRNIIYSTFGGLLLVIGFLFILYKRFKITKQLNQTIGEQKTDLETSHNALKKTSESINSSINYASRIQKSILTSDSYLSNMFNEHYVFYKPKDIVSGDYYWAYESKSGNKIWAVVDCTGHGIPGGFMSMIGNTLLNEIIVERAIEDPGEILNELRLGVIKTLDQNEDADSNRDGMTIGLCVYNPVSLTISYAGSETPLYIVRNDELIEHAGQQETIALAKTMTDFQAILVQLEPGDWIYLSTDGFPDARGGNKGKKYMYGRFREQLILLSKLSADKQLKQLEKEYDGWVGDFRQMDDICVMGVRV